MILETQSEMFERIVRDRHGRLFRVRFVVVERGGVLRGKVVSVAPIAARQKRFKIYDFGFKNKKQYLIQGYIEKIADNQSRTARIRINSPYFSIFEFLTPIKIRAPSGTRMGAD